MATKIAVIGAGYWGPNLIRNFANLPEAELATVCDLDRGRLARLAEQYPDLHTTTRLDEVLADQTIAGVAIATPAATHCELATACLDAGKHVYVEKPLAGSSRDAAAILDRARENDRILMVGHIFLYEAAISRLIAETHGGAVGELRYLHGVRTSMAGTARLDTNIIWDALVHDAYILPALFGRLPQRVLAVGAKYLSPDLEDVAFVTFDFGNDVLAHIYVSWYALEKARRMTLVGSDAILQYDDLAATPLVRFERRYEQGTERDPQGRLYWHWRDDGGSPVPLERTEPLRDECAHFVDCIVTGRRPRTDGLAGLEAVQVLEACQRSLDAGNQWVEVAADGR